jgi:hypothetical protein
VTTSEKVSTQAPLLTSTEARKALTPEFSTLQRRLASFQRDPAQVKRSSAETPQQPYLCHGAQTPEAMKRQTAASLKAMGTRRRRKEPPKPETPNRHADLQVNHPPPPRIEQEHSLRTIGRILWILSGVSSGLLLGITSIVDWSFFRASYLPPGTYTGQEDDASSAWSWFGIFVTPPLIFFTFFVYIEVTRRKRRSQEQRGDS